MNIFFPLIDVLLGLRFVWNYLKGFLEEEKKSILL